jgi:ubiquinone/menaquinone biosynthesis C-methylase UbiE
MKNTKYYDHKNNRPVDLERDGCALSEWEQLYGKAAFATHPNGFNVFLPPDRIVADDEYSASDPYTVEHNLDDEFHGRRIELTIDLVREAISSVQGTPQILDIGCGEGHITEKMRQALDSAEFTGLDHSLSAIAYASKHFPQIDFSVADAHDCPYAKEFFDLVVCNNLWEHIPDPLTFLSGISRTLKPGGYLVVSTPSRYRVRNLVRIVRGKPVVLMSRNHVTEYTVGQIIEQLNYGGFETTRILSRPISDESLNIALVRRMCAMFLSLVGSHHQLEATVFYLAKKLTRTAELGVRHD